MDKEILKFYSEFKVQKALVDYSFDREVAVSFGGKGYGKRPDTLNYPADVLDMVKGGATSFHVSEERWDNVLMLNPNMTNKDKDKLRIGWDIVIDIDAPNWKISKLITWLIYVALKNHGIQNVSVKFSGNKGFHIGVPFESFPKIVSGKVVAKQFPSMARSVAAYLLDYIDTELIQIKDNYVTFNNKYRISLDHIQTMTKQTFDDLTLKLCSSCKTKITKDDKPNQKIDHICPNCNSSMILDEDLNMLKCSKCNSIEQYTPSKEQCSVCNTTDLPITKFNSLSVVEVDTILISSRHLYRAQYSINEKSGLVSIPIDPEKILTFSKESAKFENIIYKPEFAFLDSSKSIENEAENLFLKASMFSTQDEIEKVESKYKSYDEKEQVDLKYIEEEHFPPCIKKTFVGLKDGKKRSIFILVNFLTMCGWTKNQIRDRIHEWNLRNEDADEALKEVYINGQLRSSFMLNKKILPPNCDNKMYYKDLGMCEPDGLCARIKNPVQYATIKANFSEENKPKKKAVKKTEEKDGDKKPKKKTTKKKAKAPKQVETSGDQPAQIQTESNENQQ